MKMIFTLCYFFTWIVLVSNVPVAPIIPTQTYPLYQQSEFIIPPASSPNDINPLPLQNTAQNENNQSPFNFKQILLNRILSRPSLQAILDPNIANYGLNGHDLQSTPSLVPSVVNNYIILPLECPSINQTDITKTIKAVDDQTDKASDKKGKKKSKSNERRKSRDQLKTKTEKVEPTYEKPKSEKKSSRSEDDEFVPPKLRENNDTNVTKPVQTLADRKINTVSNRSDRDNRRDGGKKRKQRENEASQIVETIKENNNKSQENATTNKSTKRRKPKTTNNGNDVNTQNVKTNQNVTETALNGSTNTIKTKSEVVTNKAKTHEANTKNYISKDFLKTFPSIPEDMASYFFTGHNQFSDAQMKNLFSNYQNFYQNMAASTQGSNKRNKKRKKGKKIRRNKRRNQKKVQKGVNIVKNSVKPSDNSSNVNKSIPNDVFIKNDYALPVKEEIVESVKDFDIITKLDEVDAVNKADSSAHYVGLIEDYYPLFDNAAFNTDSKEVFVRNLENDKFYYSRDTVVQTDKKYDLPKAPVDDRDITVHTYDSVERETIDYNFNDEEVSFRHPPLLEVPDFVTRQVKRSDITPNQYDSTNVDRVYFTDDKSSSYSNVKSPSGNTRNGINESSNHKNTVETTYARSKVVKYGQNNENDVPTSNFDDSFEDSATTIVMARSFGDGEFW